LKRGAANRHRLQALLVDDPFEERRNERVSPALRNEAHWRRTVFDLAAPRTKHRAGGDV